MVSSIYVEFKMNSMVPLRTQAMHDRLLIELNISIMQPCMTLSSLLSKEYKYPGFRGGTPVARPLFALICNTKTNDAPRVGLIFYIV